MEIEKYDTIIVGGGIAGITSAVYLAKAGKKILLVEKNPEFGGLVSSFNSNGFHFEAGVRALESAGIILPMLKELGIEIETVRSKVSIGVENKVIHVEDINSISDYRNMLVSLYPESTNDIDKFIKSMRKIMKLLDVLYGIENPLFKDLKKDTKYIFKTLLPWLPKFIFTVGKINRLDMPFEIYLGNLIKDKSLQDIISQHFFRGTPTFFALSYFSLYLDYFYPKGGVDTLVDVLVQKIKDYNGSLLPNTSITKLNADLKFVIDNNNKKYEYNNLVWAADLKTFYSITELGNLSNDIKNSFKKKQKQIHGSKGSESVFSLYLEVDVPLSYFGTIAHGHFFYTPSKHGLGEIHRSELKNLIQNWENRTKKEVAEWLQRFLKYNTYEISIPGLKDSNLVPENKTGVIISFIVDYQLFKKLEDSGWYNEFKKEIETTIIDIISSTIFPEIKNKIENHFCFTPISYKNRIANTDGSIVGWSFEEESPVVNKIQRSSTSAITPIPTIFQAGQWTYSPAGVPMSILTGKLAANRVCKLKN